MTVVLLEAVELGVGRRVDIVLVRCQEKTALKWSVRSHHADLLCCCSLVFSHLL